MNAESNASPRKYAVALIGCISGVAVAATGPATNCNVGYLQGTVSSATHLSAASIVAATATTPEYCRVDGTIHTPTSQALTFAVGLPTSWNDKFVMLTQGGFAGAVPNPAGNSGVAASPPPLSKGYATASTDTGHRGGAFDASFLIGRPDLSIDFGHRGNKLTVDTAKALMKGYYQADPKRSLLVGCSNGGRSTMIHSQRYPNDFDGYVVGAPAWDWPGMLGLDFHHSNASFFSNAGAWMSPAKVKLLSDAVLAACDLKDGVKDGLIEEPRACTFNPASLICTSGDSDSCLTVTQVAAVKKYAADMKNSHGDVLSPPWLLNGDEAAGMTQWKLGATPPPIGVDGKPAPVYPTLSAPNAAQAFSFIFENGAVGWQTFDNPNWSWKNWDLDQEVGALAQTDGIASALDTNVMPTVSRGAKFLIYHGWGDQALNPLRTIEYYNGVVAKFGKSKTDTFLRVFMVPGMQHCSGGTNATDRFDPIDQLEKWLDSEKAPDIIVASHVTSGTVTHTRPLCAYPKVARFNYGPGAEPFFDPAFWQSLKNDWRNFTCVDPSATGGG